MMLMSIEEDELDYQVMNPTAVVKGQLQQVFRSAASLLLLSTTLPKSALAVAEEAATLDQQDLEVISLKDASRFVGEVEANRALNTDEYEIAFDTESLGLRLGEKYYQGGVILTVNDIIDKTMIDKYPALTVGSIVVRVNGEYVENQPLMTIAGKIKASPRPVKIQFRDPSR